MFPSEPLFVTNFISKSIMQYTIARIVFQYGIYPVLTLTAATLLIYLIGSGYNYYLVSLPIITGFGLLIMVLERIFPYEKRWLTNWDVLFKNNYDNFGIKSTLGQVGIKEEPNFLKSYFQQFIYPFSKRIRNKSKLLILLPLILFYNSIYGQTSNDIIGKWDSSDKKVVIEVYKTNNTFSAKVIQSTNASDIGKVIAWDLKYNSAKKEWSGGQVQKPDMEHAASCFIVINETNSFTVTGYHGFRFLGKSEKYFRKNK